MQNVNNKKRNLFICNTTYQLLVCINIVLKKTSKEENDIILTDRTDFTKTAENLMKEGLFNKVSLIFPKALYKEITNMKERRLRLEGIVAPEKSYIKKYGIKFDFYDSLYACNMTDMAIIEAYTILARRNPELLFFEIEDGYGTYVRPMRNPDLKRSLKKFIFEAFNAPYLSVGKIHKSLLFFPELYIYPDHVPKEQLPLMNLEDPEIQELLQRVFGCRGYHIDKKFIILEEPFKAEGRVNNVEELFTKIVDWVGKNNVMLKTHPRNGKNTYYERDIQIFDAPVAWEALIAAEDLDDKVLITGSSGTSFNTKLLYHSKCKIIFLYKLLKGELSSGFLSSVTPNYFFNFQKSFPNEVFIPETENELKELLLLYICGNDDERLK